MVRETIPYDFSSIEDWLAATSLGIPGVSWIQAALDVVSKFQFLFSNSFTRPNNGRGPSLFSFRFLWRF